MRAIEPPEYRDFLLSPAWTDPGLFLRDVSLALGGPIGFLHNTTLYGRNLLSGYSVHVVNAIINVGEHAKSRGGG